MTASRLLVLGACALVPASTLRAQVTTIDNVTIVDASNGRLHQRQTIAIEGTRIVRIGNASAATRVGATLDGTGMYVIPGLWDMHVHAYSTNDSQRFHTTSEVMFPLFIANGGTGVRDLGSNLEATIGARDSIAAHQLVGPRMLVSGPMIDGPTGRYAAAINVATPDEARSAVRMLKGRGVDMIKTQTLIPREAYFALADEATRIGIPFEGHVPSAITALEAVQAKQRSFEHLIGGHCHEHDVDPRDCSRGSLAVPDRDQQRGNSGGLRERPSADLLAEAAGGVVARRRAPAPHRE